MVEKKSKHHFIPRSREGGNGPNTIFIPHDLHTAWHHLFYNLYPWEIIEHIEAGIFDYACLTEGRRLSWDFVFGDKSQDQVIAHIRTAWFPPQEYLEHFLEDHGLLHVLETCAA